MVVTKINGKPNTHDSYACNQYKHAMCLKAYKDRTVPEEGSYVLHNYRKKCAIYFVILKSLHLQRTEGGMSTHP